MKQSDMGRFVASIAEAGCEYTLENPPATSFRASYGMNPGMQRNEDNDRFWAKAFTYDLRDAGLATLTKMPDGTTLVRSFAGPCAASN